LERTESEQSLSEKEQAMSLGRLSEEALDDLMELVQRNLYEAEVLIEKGEPSEDVLHYRDSCKHSGEVLMEEWERRIRER
jgi:hypothetical protein